MATCARRCIDTYSPAALASFRSFDAFFFGVIFSLFLFAVTQALLPDLGDLIFPKEIPRLVRPFSGDLIAVAMIFSWRMVNVQLLRAISVILAHLGYSWTKTLKHRAQPSGVLHGSAKLMSKDDLALEKQSGNKAKQGFPKTSPRLAGMSSNIWQSVDEWSQQSAIQPVVNLGIGRVEFNPPEFVINTYKQALDNVACNQYSPSSLWILGKGDPVLKSVLADTFSHHLGQKLKPDKNICITRGASEALLAALNAFVEPGDEVIVMQPLFEGYRLLINFVGGTMVTVPLDPPANVHEGVVSADEWKLDLHKFHKALTPRKKMLILNTPHNPLGKVFNAEEVLDIGHFCVRNSLVLLSDEVYEHLSYDRPFIRPAATSSAIFDHTLSVGSLGKAFNATGWRVGHIIGPEQLIRPVCLAHTLLAYSTAGPVQRAVADGLKMADKNSFWETNLCFMKKRVSQFTKVLQLLGLPYTEPMGVFFVFVSISNVDLPAVLKYYSLAVSTTLVKFLA